MVFRLENFPVQIGEFLEQRFKLLMTTRHSPNLIDHGRADVFGSCFTVFLERQAAVTGSVSEKFLVNVEVTQS